MYCSKLRKKELEIANPAEFWQRINALIKSKKATQTEIADLINVPYITFRSWSHRKFYPDVNKIYAIAQVLDTTVEYLIFGAAEPVNKNSQNIGESLLSLFKIIKDGLN